MKLRENRLLLIWLFWVGLIIFGCVVAYFQGWWGLVHEGDPTKLSFSIVGVFTIGLLINMRNMFNINRELKNAMEVYNFYEKNYSSKQIIEATWKNTDSSLSSGHIMNLNKIAFLQQSGEVDQTALIETMTAELEAPESWTRYIAIILASLGFLGTLIGFLMSMRGLDSLMSIDKSNAIQGLQQAIHGMGTAFYTTLVGVVFGAIFLELLHHLLSNAITKLMIIMSKVGEVYVIPSLKAKWKRSELALGEMNENPK